MNTPNNLEWLDFLDQLSEYNKLGSMSRGDLADTCNVCGISPSKLKQTIATKLAEAYKQGYIDGGIATLTNDKEDV